MVLWRMTALAALGLDICAYGKMFHLRPMSLVVTALVLPQIGCEVEERAYKLSGGGAGLWWRCRASCKVVLSHPLPDLSHVKPASSCTHLACILFFHLAALSRPGSPAKSHDVNGLRLRLAC